ncbi:heavy-metal-associated domain-containing protein [Lapidilactobacillus luobeiensis]|uniref:heavy-metal-associated domain-containing protein n=1 Tax=Lapidilactobacillus luobeiensis TaxID=2950371 RepID=UPI0021C35DEE|nr:cation transporter [Lapidilactobacillus luobeiensis]
MAKLTIILEPLACPVCFEHIQAQLADQPGVGEVGALFEKNELELQFNIQETTAAKLAQVVSDLGYNIAKTKID